MKKIVIFITFVCMPLLEARTIKIINNTGVSLRAKVERMNASPIEHIIPTGPTEEDSTYTIDIGNNCFTHVFFAISNGPNKGKSKIAYGRRRIDTCVDTTFAVEIKDDELKWFRK